MLLHEFAKLGEATLPPEHRGIARDAVRMLVTDRTAHLHEDRHFYNLAEFVRPGDVVIINDSATLPAALRTTRKTGGGLMLHVGTAIDASLWIAEPRPSVPGETLGIQPGEKLSLESGGSATLIAPLDAHLPRLWYTHIDLPLPMHAFLAKFGEPIRYSYVSERLPLTEYQTMFARIAGSAEMPSAARPFTPQVVSSLRRAGARVATITLHCGISSFEKPERPAIERYTVPQSTANTVNAARREGHHIIAIGTTVIRALESSRSGDAIIASSGWTDLIVDSSHPPSIADALLSGFHQPTATHLDLLRAFASDDILEEAYSHAAERHYLCHEFGDMHLIL